MFEEYTTSSEECGLDESRFISWSKYDDEGNYLHKRYLELTGKHAPTCGASIRSELSKNERANDTVARHAIPQELGHERKQITVVYLGV